MKKSSGFLVRNASLNWLAEAMTPHALVRAQQRGIEMEALSLLLQYGHREHDHAGCQVATFNDAALEAIARFEPYALWRKASEARTLYAVINSDGGVVTAGHRYRRVIRDKSLSAYRTGRSRRPHVLHSTSYRYAH